MIGIYKITSKIDSTIFYIGKSNNIQRRFKEHIQKTYQQSRIPFDDYINKDNQNDFNFDILEECSLNELNSKEKYWVDKFDAKNFCNKFERIFKSLVFSDTLIKLDQISANIPGKTENSFADSLENIT